MTHLSCAPLMHSALHHCKPNPVMLSRPSMLQLPYVALMFLVPAKRSSCDVCSWGLWLSCILHCNAKPCMCHPAGGAALHSKH